jgi:hypothetical protein
MVVVWKLAVSLTAITNEPLKLEYEIWYAERLQTYIKIMYEVWLWRSQNDFIAIKPVSLQLIEKDHLWNTPLSPTMLPLMENIFGIPVVEQLSVSFFDIFNILKSSSL